MEIFFTLLVIACASIALMAMKWVSDRRERQKLLRRCGIPGPDPALLTGNLKDIKSKSTPNETITVWLKKYGSVFGYYLGGLPYIIVKDLDILKQIFIKDFHLFCNRHLILDISPLNKTLVGLTDKRWKEVRTLLTPTFTSGKIKLMSNIVSKKVDITVEVVTKKARNKEMFDIYELVQGLTLDVIADCALAMKTHCQENSQDIFLISVRNYFRYASNPAVEYAIMFPSVVSIMSFINKFMTAGQMTDLIVDSVNTAIAERRKNPETKSMDLLQLMIDHREKDEIATGLTDEEIIANAWIFLLAGYETTATALAFTFYLLIKHPEIQERLYREIEKAEDDSYASIQNLQYLDQVFSESLRLYPPVTGFISRICSEDYRVGSMTIPKGAVVQAAVWDIHHDPELWPEPWKFDPDRFAPENRASLNSMAYMPFGIGRRNCIGARFAHAEAKLALFRLVKKFRFETCEKTDDPLPLICPTVIINPGNGVYLRAVPRTALA
ncbi:Cytochrome P450 3A28 like protein [Argiope bruennichi]|uniref:Thromboxane-A synthase n=1 Tax=Argiope bruennichi TaxID=94029 RepID=A0A8T0EXB5_ARGBR|nr:Cytochrome P450 3A28 like protein [Argiope bruennichi]